MRPTQGVLQARAFCNSICGVFSQRAVGGIGQLGMRNSLLVAPMPTASTAQILGNNESFEPYTQNLYVRRVLSGEFVQVNRLMLRDLIQRGLWTEDMRMQLVAHNGS